MATKSTAINGTSWTDLGTTPCFLELVGTNEVVFVIEVVAPGDIKAEGHILSDNANQGERTANVSITNNRVFARTERADLVASVIVTR